MLSRMRVRGFKSLDDVEIELSRLVVLVGPNSAGKSNFLEALLLLSRMVTERTLADAFEGLRGYPAEAFQLPGSGLVGLLQTDRAELSLEADLDCDDGEHIRYRLGVEFGPQKGTLSVVDEYLTRLSRRGEPRGGFLPRIEVVEGESPGSSRRLAVRQVGEAGRPRYESLGLGHSLASNLQYSGERRFPDLDRLRAELAGWHVCYLDPREAMRAAQPPREVTDIGGRGEHLAPFLHRLKQDPQHRRHFEAVKRALRSIVPIDGLDVDLDPRRGTLDIRVTQDGVPYSSRVISEGTLRVLALAALAANPWRQGLVAFEEPENGVHPRRIQTVARLVSQMSQMPQLGARQVIVTTHSPAFAAAVAQLATTGNIADDVRIIAVHKVDRATRVRSLPTDLGLFRDGEIHEALRDPMEERQWETLLSHGWL